jgi:signal-transduction protein with cAMP-binding, CBS, and nucleotidyltransferase domain
MSQLLTPEVAALSGITAFQDLPPEVLDWLVQAGELRQYAAGEVVVEPGSPADRLLAVVAGAVQYYAVNSIQARLFFG